ncbi:MAG: hypothetical protein QM757_21705 [Paludibaculum sp.]
MAVAGATSLYFGNTTDSSLSVQLKFYASDGSALYVPAAGGSTATMTLAARGAAVIEALDSGALTSGWVQATVPDGVIGYGVFRQSVTDGRAQEAVVPLSGTTTATATMLFDENSFVTAAALVNPSATAGTVTISVRNDLGTLLGTSTVDLAAGGKQAVALRELAGLSSMAGQRGSIDFSASNGAVSVLGLRFSDTAFTSIPAVER